MSAAMMRKHGLIISLSNCRTNRKLKVTSSFTADGVITILTVTAPDKDSLVVEKLKPVQSA
jgi:hypothetical protein